MKSFTDLFIKRPVLAMVVSFVILIAGLQAMKTINVRQYPRSDIASIQPDDAQIASAYLSFTSDILQPNQVTDYLVRLVQPRLTSVGGVQKADILGGRTFAMRVWMKPERMAALNISPADVRTALSKNNFLAAVGSTKGSLLQVNLTANTDLHTAEQFKQLVVKQDKGTLVRIGDI